MIALAYEYDSSTVFYSDIQRASLNAVHFNGSDHRVLLPRECSLCGGRGRCSGEVLDTASAVVCLPARCDLFYIGCRQAVGRLVTFFDGG